MLIVGTGVPAKSEATTSIPNFRSGKLGQSEFQIRTRASELGQRRVVNWNRWPPNTQILEPMRCQLGIAYGVLDVLVTKICL